MSQHDVGRDDTQLDALDLAIAAEIRTDVIPDHYPDFWSDLWNNLDAEVEADRPTPSAGHNPDVIELDSAAGRAASDTGGGRGRILSMAAAIVLVLGMIGFLLAPERDGSTVVASDGDSTQGVPAPDADEPGPPRQVISPLIDLEQRMQSTSDATVFTARTDEPTYWRLTALDTLIGQSWFSDEDYVARPAGDVRFDLTAEVILIDRSQPWLPVPATMVAIDTGAVDVTHGTSSGAVIINGEATAAELAETLTYRVSFAPSGQLPVVADLAEVAAHNLMLPEPLSTSAQMLAKKWTADALSPRDKALALEFGFWTELSVDLMTDLPESINARSMSAVADEVLAGGAGDVEQLVSTYVLMARTVGLPARIAVGYLPGEAVAGLPGVYKIRDRDSHAWAEVLIDGTWVQFNPTPGRGTPTNDSLRPLAGQDHWHAMFAMYDCRSGSYLDPIGSSESSSGIHDEGDGLIHIAPTSVAVGGPNATLGRFFDAVGVEATGGLTLDGQEILAQDATCDGEPAQLHLRKWQFDFVTDSTLPFVIESDFENVRFENDREVYLIALAPIDGEIPPLPLTLRDALDAAAGAITTD